MGMGTTRPGLQSSTTRATSGGVRLPSHDYPAQMIPQLTLQPMPFSLSVSSSLNHGEAKLAYLTGSSPHLCNIRRSLPLTSLATLHAHPHPLLLLLAARLFRYNDRIPPTMVASGIHSDDAAEGSVGLDG